MLRRVNMLRVSEITGLFRVESEAEAVEIERARVGEADKSVKVVEALRLQFGNGLFGGPGPKVLAPGFLQ